MAVLACVLVIATAGYVAIGLDPFDAFYQTAISVTTVGYGEIGVDEVDRRAYRVWTLAVVLFGAGTAIYTVGVLVETLVEQGLEGTWRRRRMGRQIDELSGHVIVAGAGRVGTAIAEYARRQGARVVVVDVTQPTHLEDELCIVGDATDDETLLDAGIDRARTLVAALDSDAKNLYVTLSARSLAPDLFIVVRTNEQAAEPKFLQAGADRVVNPHKIGGSRMAALALQPHVAEFLDEVLHDDTHDVALLEFLVHEGSPVAGARVVDIGGAGKDRALVVAIRSPNGWYRSNPPPDTVLVAGDVIIAVGSAAQLRALGERIGDPTAVEDLRPLRP